MLYRKIIYREKDVTKVSENISTEGVFERRGVLIIRLERVYLQKSDRKRNM